jgi:hypothetical protein
VIRTAFRLPFRAVHPAQAHFFESRGEVVVAFEFEREPTAEQAAKADAILQGFIDLALTGALSGQRIAPGRSRVDAGPVSLRSPRTRACNLTRCRIDDAAVVLLCDMLLRDSDALQLRSFAASDGGEMVELAQDPDAWSTYPQRHATLPFELDDQEPESGGYTFVLDLAEPLQPEAEGTLGAWLGIWLRSVLAGAYALAPIHPKDNYVEPGDPPVSFATTVEWSVFKLRAHPAAIDGLVNLLASFSDRVQRIVRVTIQ